MTELLLAIETSCDETAASVVAGDGRILSNAVASQIEDHAIYGGVVPEIASRRHAELIEPVLTQALQEAGVTLRELDGIAVTQGPGLVGALLVGISFAKALAYGLKIPLVGVNHLDGHLSAAAIEHAITYPHIGMVVSGGHTSLYEVDAPGHMRQIGQTLDDAAGEAFDKVAKLLGLGYPGGVVIERLAKDVGEHGLELPRPLLKEDHYNFSFSGLKTAILNLVMKLEIFPELNLRFSGLPKKRLPAPGKEDYIARIAAAFQEAAVDVLVAKAMKAVREKKADLLVVSGGVACNTALREALAAAARQQGIRLAVPAKKYCTDNAVMIGLAGLRSFQQGKFAGLDLNAVSRWDAL